MPLIERSVERVLPYKVDREPETICRVRIAAATQPPYWKVLRKALALRAFRSKVRKRSVPYPPQGVKAISA